MAKPFKVDELLKDEPDDRAAFEEYARDPGRTIDECLTWLQARGYTLSRSAVGAWKQDFDARVLTERFSRNSELASAIKGAVEAGKFESVADAAVMQLTNVVFEQAAKLEAEGQIDPLDVQRMTKSLANLTGSKKSLNELRDEYERRQREAIAAAEQAAKAGQSGVAVADVVKKYFGL